jgi:hypothetical protein
VHLYFTVRLRGLLGCGCSPGDHLLRIGGTSFLNGTFGGEFVTLQLRVWENGSGSVRSWSEALAHPELVIGKSELVSCQLSGPAADGTPVLAKNFAHLLPSFTISTVCPEPSGYLLLGLTAGGLLWCRMRGSLRGEGSDCGHQ